MDQSIFFIINHLPHSAFLDLCAEFFSGIGQWGAVWFVIAILLFLREEKRDHRFFAPFLFAGTISVLISELLLKLSIARPRPTEAIGAIIRSTPGNYSFPSTHATIAWAMAYVLAREEPRLRFWFYLLAILISLSRIYLGVHYPSDIIGGALVGSLIGYISMRMEIILRPNRIKQKKS